MNNNGNSRAETKRQRLTVSGIFRLTMKAGNISDARATKPNNSAEVALQVWHAEANGHRAGSKLIENIQAAINSENLSERHCEKKGRWA
jgi:hypothetical protein